MVGRKYNGTVCEDVAIPDELTAKIDPLRDMLIESVAESDEELMEKYFEGEEFTKEEIQQGLRAGVLEGDVVPVPSKASSRAKKRPRSCAMSIRMLRLALWCSRP